MNDNLPPLPEPARTETALQNTRDRHRVVWYSAHQMQAYARAAIEKDRERQSVPASQDAANLLARYERQWHRMGELWERCQGKGWTDKESAEFHALRDEKSPATRYALIAMLAAAPQPQQGPVAIVKIIGYGKDYRPCQHETGEWRDEDGVCVEFADGNRDCIYVSDLLYTSPQAAQPLSDADVQQISRALHHHGLTLVRTAQGFGVMKLGEITAYAATKGTT